MSYAEWTPPESYWVINAGITYRVDERTAHRVCDEYERGDKMLLFTEATGAQVRLPAVHFYGTYESTPQTRDREQVIRKMVEAEGEEFS